MNQNISFILAGLNTAGIALIRQELPSLPISICHNFQDAVRIIRKVPEPTKTVALIEVGLPRTNGSNLHSPLSILLQNVAAKHRLNAILIGTNKYQNDDTSQAIRELDDRQAPRHWYLSKQTLSVGGEFSTEVFFIELPFCERGSEVISHPYAIDWPKVINSYTEYLERELVSV